MKVADEEDKERTRCKVRSEKVGLVLARNAYKLMKTGQGQTAYENKIAVHSEKGIDVGNFNHSRKLAAEFTSSVYDVLKDRKLKLLH